MSHAGIKRLTLNYLTPSSTDFLIVGVIIAKRPPKSFKSKKDGTERGVMGFTLRDSPADYINVTVWGSPMFVENFHSTYHVGDVVDLINAKVIMRKPGEKEDLFQPPVTSCMELVFNENHSQICLHDFDDSMDFIKIFHLPTKPPGNFLSLADIKSNGKLFNGQYVNILVAVQQVGGRKKVRGRSGQESSVLEVTVLDKTSSSFVVQTWDEDMIQRALNWRPRDTVLFMSDVRTDWNEYRKAMTATVTVRSVVTENPATREAAILAAFAQSVPIQAPALADSLAASLVEPESIVNVMSCSSVLDQAWSRESSDAFTALVYSVLQQFDIDGSLPIIVKKCPNCGLEEEGPVCPRGECSGGEPIYCYDMRLSLVDHTGHLTGCRLDGRPASSVFPIKAEEFKEVTSETKTELKWEWLLKRVAAKLLVFPVSPGRSHPFISVVALRKVSLQEYASRTPIA